MKRRWAFSTAVALAGILLLSTSSASATRIAGREFWAGVHVEETAALQVKTRLVTRGTGQSAQVGTGTTEKVNFTCNAVAVGVNVTSTGILVCEMIGQGASGGVYSVPNLPAFRPGNEASTSRTFTGPTQPYKLCVKGAWVDTNNVTHEGTKQCDFPL